MKRSTTVGMVMAGAIAMSALAQPAVATGASVAPLVTRQGAQPGALEAVDRAVAAWRKVRTMRATIEQQVTNPLTGSTVTARGESQMRRPGQLSIRFTQPVGDVIVSDGRTLWLYLPSSLPGQVIRTRLGKSAAGSLDLTDQFLTSPRTRYTITDAGKGTAAGRAARIVHLAPKEGQALPFLRAKVWIDDQDALIRQFEVTEANGVTRRVTLTDVKPNAKVDASAFDFTPPSGARIVER
jgi:outer membrane lipoprotein carrier protein